MELALLRESGPTLKVSSPDVAQIAADLHSVAIRLLRQVRQEDDASGLTSARLSALSVLVFGGRLTLGELARAERVSLPTMTRIAAALCKAGYAKRMVDPDDRRYVHLEATRRGVALLNEGRRRRLERVGTILATLRQAEGNAALVRLESALSALAKVLER
jgi:DNA-binding MarR family transcriptional regulator